MTTIDFGSKQRRAVGNQRVYLRQKWQDAWTPYLNLHATEVTWCLSPSMPSATLQWDYGWVKGLYDRFPYVAQKLDVSGWYVKIVMETDVLLGTENTWYGVIEDQEDEHGGIVSKDGISVASGQQTLHCFGMEKLLDQEYLSESWVDTGLASPLVVQLPIVFNRGGRPNRNDRVFDHYYYAFEGQQLTPGGTLRPKAQWWSTFDICDYLLHWATPKESFRTRNRRVLFVLENVKESTPLPTKDRPVVEQEGQTVLSILNRLIDRRRLRSFYVTVDETQTLPDTPPRNIVTVKVVAWNKDTIDTEIPDADIIKPNRNVVSLKYDRNESTTSVLRKTRLHRYDRVVCRGARRTSTATFFYDASVEAPILTAAWSSAEETAYGAAASGVAGYAGWDSLKKKQRNLEVRGSEELSAVYSWFKLPDTWTQTVIAADAATVYPVFVDGGHDAVAVPQDIHEVQFEQQLPLYEHVDYAGAIIANGTAADPPINVYRNPLIVFKVPTDARYVAGDAIATLSESTANPVGNGKNFRWSATCRVHPESRTLEVKVSGEPQHVIAETAFALVKLTADRDLGDFDYQGKEMLVTATLLDNRYAEGKYPDDGSGDSTLIDEQFGYVIYAGDEYRQDYVVPDTVVDVDADGAIVKSTGGYVRDDTPTLAALARVAYEWWHQERIILSLQTSQLTSAIQVGYLIDTIGDATIVATVPGVGQVINEHYETVNTVVSELRIAWPRLHGNQRGVPTMRFTTGAGELDPLTIAPPRTKVLSRAEAKRTHA
jgi:hypothetical protein